MDLGQRYHGSKGVPAHRQEDGVLGSLGPPGHLEESASHHIRKRSFDGLGPEISWVKGGPGMQTGGWGLGQSVPPG